MYFSLRFCLFANNDGMQTELLPTVNAGKDLSKSRHFGQNMGRVFKTEAKIQTEDKRLIVK